MGFNSNKKSHLQNPSRHNDRTASDPIHDAYRPTKKMKEPTICKECHAVYSHGDWKWGEIPTDAHQVLCPACQRINDKFPAGLLQLSGNYIKLHHKDIINLIKNVEKYEKDSHPLKRIMEINEESNEKILVSTTDMHLVRGLGEALHRAHKGELNFQYAKESDFLRVDWHRD